MCVCVCERGALLVSAMMHAVSRCGELACLTRASHKLHDKRVLHERSIRVTHKSVPHDCLRFGLLPQILITLQHCTAQLVYQVGNLALGEAANSKPLLQQFKETAYNISSGLTKSRVHFV